MAVHVGRITCGACFGVRGVASHRAGVCPTWATSASVELPNLHCAGTDVSLSVGCAWAKRPMTPHHLTVMAPQQIEPDAEHCVELVAEENAPVDVNQVISAHADHLR